MRESITLATTVQAARLAVASATRPEGMTRPTWEGVQRVLGAIAASYPRAYPSQQTLAARLDVPLRTVQRWTAAAVAAKLLVVTPDAGAAPKRANGSRTNRYHVVMAASDAATLSSERDIFSFGEDSSSSSQRTTSSGSSSASPSGLAAPEVPEPEGSTVVAMADWDDRERDVGSSAASFLRRSKRPVRRDADPDAIVSQIDSKQRKRKRAPKPPPEWRRLTEYFVVIWEQMQLTSGRHRTARPIESLNQCRTYIEAHFQNKTELEVRQMMNEFVIAVSKGHITLKPGQSAWMCFTGAWGRERHVDTGDIYAAYKEK